VSRCEEALSVLEYKLNWELDTLDTRENLIAERTEALSQREEVLNTREASL
jgi:hypothetical protein